MKKTILIFFLFISVNLIAQEKYMSLKPITWDELQLYQLDSMLSSEQLKLSKTCPSSLKKLSNTYVKSTQSTQHILGTNYYWTTFINVDGYKCLVKHDKPSSIDQEESDIINPNSYRILNNNQARILLSASKGIGFKEKGIAKVVQEVRSHNQNIYNKNFEKYGGRSELLKFIRENAPDKKLNEEFRKSRTSNDGTSFKHLSLIEVFELLYTDEQKQKHLKKSKKEQ